MNSEETSVGNSVQPKTVGSKLLTREDILNLPDAPPGERACDMPPDPKIEAALKRAAAPMASLVKGFGKVSAFTHELGKTHRTITDSLKIGAGRIFTHTAQGNLSSLSAATNLLSLRPHRAPTVDPFAVLTTAATDPGFWESFTPLDERIEEIVKNALKEHTAEVREGQEQTRPPKGRTKRDLVEPLIARHLATRPHDTAREVAEALRCSVGIVGESRAWKANRRRLVDAKRQAVDPVALPLTDYLTSTGSNRFTQKRHAQQEQALVDADIDERDKELFDRIGEYVKDHPHATTRESARALGCTAGDIELRQATLDRLTSEQADAAMEDYDQEPREPDGKPWRKQVRMQV